MYHDPLTPLLAYIDPTGGLPPSLWGMFQAGIAAAFGVMIGALKVYGRSVWLLVRRYWFPIVVLALSLLAGGAVGMKLFSRKQPKPNLAAGAAVLNPGARVLVLGFDGLDPLLLNQYLAEGVLPNFARLAAEGVYHPLRTTTPPQSPVAWATFITGAPPRDHGIFDFLKRDPKTYLPDLTIADRKTMRLPWRGTPFWESQPAVASLGLTSLRLPVTFPPPQVNGRLLSGMGVWDGRGTEGTYFYYSTTPPGPELRGMGFTLRTGPAGLEGEIPGPYRAGQPDTLREPFALVVAADQQQARLRVQQQDVALTSGKWSDWIRLEFAMGAFQLKKISFVTRVLYRQRGAEVTLYVSPLNFDPAAPLYAISSPKNYAAEIREQLGCYHTRGMPFDTQALNDGVLDDAGFLDQWRTIMDEDERLLDFELARFSSGMLFSYFEGTDIIQHMFWRSIDPEHPLYNSAEAAASRDVIRDCYRRCDAILGKSRAALGPGGAVVVISDHGFAPFRHAVHLNTILRAGGYLTLKPGQATSGEFFEGVDWAKTQAYALGFNAVYLNLRGREGQGSVDPATAGDLTAKLGAYLEQYTEAGATTHPIKKVYQPGGGGDAPELIVGYARGFRGSWETALGAVPGPTVELNTKKWSGDHCIDPDEVPGIFLSSRRDLDAGALADVAAAVGQHLGHAH